MDELDQLLDTLRPDVAPDAEVVDRNRHELRSAMGTARTAEVGATVAAIADDDVLDLTPIEPARHAQRWRRVAVAAAFVAVAGTAAVALGSSADEPTTAGFTTASSPDLADAAADELVCGPVLPDVVSDFPGMDGPFAGPSGDFVDTPTDPGQLIEHWRTDDAVVEVRWPISEATIAEGMGGQPETAVVPPRVETPGEWSGAAILARTTTEPAPPEATRCTIIELRLLAPTRDAAIAHVPPVDPLDL